MTAYDSNFPRHSRGLLGWLGFARTRREPVADHGVAIASPSPQNLLLSDKREQRRRQLLEDISSFLLTHRLEVSAYTLAVAHDALTGSDQKLARMVEERVAARQPVTLEWLEEAGRTCGRGDGSAMLDQLMARLETSLDQFSRTTDAAKTATSEYSAVLQAHVCELEEVTRAGLVITELAAIARVMLDRTREIEQEMSRSDLQTRDLQRSLEDARRQAEVDHLTGLPNRRAFEAVLEQEHAAALASGEPLCVAFCDIDHFKRINDSHGHEAGDRVLRTVARTLARISGDRCHVARHGGEEFVILIRGQTMDEAWRTLDATREAMAERRLVNRATDIPFGRITFSGGIADVLAHATPRAALKAADDALYVAKNQGRNRILRADEDIVKVAA